MTLYPRPRQRNGMSLCRLFLGSAGFFLSTQFLAHGRENLLRKCVLLAGTETGEERGRKNIDRDSLINRRLDSPSPFAGVLNKSGVLGKRGIFRQGHRCKIEQPRTDYASPPPHFGDVSEIQIIALIFGQLLTGSVAEDVETLCIRLH